MNKSVMPPQSDFIVTKEYKRFVEFCDACRRHQYIGLCYGKPGVGKTLSARHYTQWDHLQTLFSSRFDDELTAADANKVVNRDTIFYTAPVANTPRKIEQEVQSTRRRLTFLVDDIVQAQQNDPDYNFNYRTPDITKLIIVDEADRLKMAGLEQLRDIYDRGGTGLIFIGMPGIEKRWSRYPQLYSRVGFAHQFKALNAEETRFIISHKWQQLGLHFDPNDFTDTEAIATIIQMTGGNFRLLHRLFTQIERVLEINQLRTITKEVVEAARDNLVIGSVL